MSIRLDAEQIRASLARIPPVPPATDGATLIVVTGSNAEQG